ncbi:uncharacterized protein Z519_12213 [Cladophialophora bantiana CBS 173.52]|uniref:Major facilitator superfamily (MFS) profile domain-containing protein n=1 Tax=Cladophialophora bantiana (strain ATCC 10958 / CBS 173.52 / CDC B-1940 / NIH 8579) TaxID=1442370 RepID=A0A0D2FK79_CLAB1|nr:uncharacterized protein Z519_12213 [Cladophialophora bantiana CBS 173.52]KIW87102.1 hypothetical protein Z519_12213 [Cladophialophora bantiana CBS 173.52]
MKFRTLRELGHDERSVTLVDNLNSQSEDNPHLRGTDIVLVPAPSSDVNDPLRFHTWKKWTILANTICLTFVCNFWLGGLVPAFYILTQEFNISESQSTGLLTWPLLAAGLCNFFWVPTAEYLGRRPVFVICSVMTFACCVWASVATSYSSLLSSRTIGSFFSSCHEALGPVIVNDIFFLHERAEKVAFFVLGIYGGNSLGTVISGFIVQGVGWRWTSGVIAIVAGINMITIFFCFPETRYNRSLDSVATRATAPTHTHTAEDNDVTGKSETTVEHINTITDDSAIAPFLTGTKKTYWQELSLWSGRANHSFVNHLIRPFPLLAYPSVAWGTLSFSCALAWLIGAASLSSFIFQVAPYNFGPGVNGLVQLAGLIGNLVGAFFGGHLSDVYVRYVARRNGGQFSPEARLVLLCFGAVVCPVGLLMFGIGAERKWHWAVLYVGYGMMSVMPNLAVIAMTYSVDSYFEVASEALLVINGVKAVAAFGFSYGFIPWTAEAGYSSVFGAMAGIWWFSLLLAIPLYIWGPQIRKYSTENMKVILF